MSEHSVDADKREGKLKRLLALQDLQPFDKTHGVQPTIETQSVSAAQCVAGGQPDWEERCRG
jgi:hypothetical protein